MAALAVASSPAPGGVSYISPIADPLLQGKTLERSLRLLKKSVGLERTMKQRKKSLKEGEGSLSAANPAATVRSRPSEKYIKRGVQEVTKSLRKGEKGIVFVASDVYPVDIIAHLPIMCEHRDVVYAYLGSKKTLGAACRSKRPSSVLMVAAPRESSKRMEASAGGEEEESQGYNELYLKVDKAIRKIHSWF